MTTAPHSLLLVKPSSLGDIVHTLPALDALHRSWPETAIDWIVKPEWMPLLEGHPLLRDVLPFPHSWNSWRTAVRELRRRRYGMVIDLQGLLRSGVFSLLSGSPVRVGFANGREGSPWCYTHRIMPPDGPDHAPMHAIDRYLHLVGQLGVSTDRPRAFPLPSWPEAEAWADQLWRQERIDRQEPVCVIHPAARWSTKRWPAERYATLADRLAAEHGWRIVMVAAPAQRDQAAGVSRAMRERSIDLVGRTTLPQLAAVLRRATVMVTNDSGPMHLAAAVGTPVVALFGPTDPRAVGPYGTGHTVVRKAIDCSSCSRQHCVKALACLNAISIDEVMMVVSRYMGTAMGVSGGEEHLPVKERVQSTSG